jgi:Na+/H+ antiporter NhaD/arsenite permease-like protein
MKILLTSKAFWTALVSVIAVLVMRYTAIPEEVWQSIAALLSVIIGIFTVDDLENGIRKTMRESIAEMREMVYKIDRS